MASTIPTYLGPDAVSEIVAWADASGPASYQLVADDHTWRALGERVYQALHERGYAAQAVLLQPGSAGEVLPDEEQIARLLWHAASPEKERPVYLAVGSGTITDLTRFVSHRTGCPFLSLPTAASVDAYASRNAPLILRRLKQTAQCHTALAILADLPTLSQAPHRMTASGFGDLLGKYTCLADWELAGLLWDEPYRADIAKDNRALLPELAANAGAIGRDEPQAIEGLFQGLLVSGHAMVRMGNSRPASGAEHHLAHYWESLRLRQGQVPLLHGASVGVGAVLIAEAYAQLRTLTQDDVRAALERTPVPTPDEQRAEIVAAYQDTYDLVYASHASFLDPDRWRRLRQRLATGWDRVLAIMAQVPEPAWLADRLRRAGAPATPEELGLSSQEVQAGLRAAHYIRDRFTVRKLQIALGQEAAHDG
jgi:glycerol-1-phosphate dehydrogenase [NAD(P)+]